MVTMNLVLGLLYGIIARRFTSRKFVMYSSLPVVLGINWFTIVLILAYVGDLSPNTPRAAVVRTVLGAVSVSALPGMLGVLCGAWVSERIHVLGHGGREGREVEFSPLRPER